MLIFVEKRAEKVLQEIKNLIYRKSISFPIKIRTSDNVYEDLDKGSIWGGRDVTVWFRSEAIQIPEDFKGEKIAIYLTLTDPNVNGLNPESLIYIDENPIQGCDRNHREIVIPNKFLEKGFFKLDIKAFSGFRDYTNKYLNSELVVIDDTTEKFFYLLRNTLDVALLYGKDEYSRDVILNIIEKTINKIDYREYGENSHYESIKIAYEFLKEELSKIPDSKNGQINCVGHSHIDVAWYWRVKHTREKSSRTFSTALNLMDQYPEFIFTQSQPQLYKYLKEDYKEIYEKIKEKVKEGTWEPIGGMWVEPDCNISSGESLVRQFLFGHRFFKEEFGIEGKTLWLPDVFGFNGNLPQIANKCGYKYFVSTKPGWNQFNRPSYDLFYWKGLDGSEILANLMTMPEHPNDEASYAYSYNSKVDQNVFRRMWKNYRHIDANNKELLMTVGHGDGGGGTERSMIETIRCSEEMPFGHKCHFEKAEVFLEKLENKLDKSKVPIWDGELYFEYHRGTLTSQGKNKWFNRKLEMLLSEVEALNSFIKIFNKDYNYPQSEINKIWETVLLNQFHDIIPGSSIKEVYEDSLYLYEEAYKSGIDLREKALNELSKFIKTEEGNIIVFNLLSNKRSSYMKIENKGLYDFYCNGKLCESSLIEGEKYYLVYVEEVPSFGYVILEKRDRKVLNSENFKQDKDEIETPFYKIKLNKNGRISSLYCKELKRYIDIEDDELNKLTAYEDKPMDFDAWDIDFYYRQKPYDITEVIDQEFIKTNARFTVKTTYKYMNSCIIQSMHLYSHIKRIDFETYIDFKEKQTLIKASFPINVRTTKATFDIHFGNIERATHNNTSWDFAKFEVPAQKWADLSQKDFGLALLNDSKYGYSVKENKIELTLLRSPIEPDPFADKCEHNFIYSIFPHNGDFLDGNVSEESYDLNKPLIAIEKKGTFGETCDNSFIDIENNGVILETVKKAEDGDGIILRLYEYTQSNTSLSIKFLKNIKDAYECNQIEEDLKPINYNENMISLEFKPFELKCILVKF